MNPNPTQETILYKVYICQNGNCTPSENARALYHGLLELIREYGLDQFDSPIRIKCQLSGCLDVCKNGPVMVVHPGAVYYQRIDLPALRKIFEQHLIGGKVVDEFTVVRASPASSQ